VQVGRERACEEDGGLDEEAKEEKATLKEGTKRAKEEVRVGDLMMELDAATAKRAEMGRYNRDAPSPVMPFSSAGEHGAGAGAGGTAMRPAIP
jgi:hypothetical protein